MKNYRILYLEDDEQTCLLAKMNLEREGFTVSTVRAPSEIDKKLLKNYSLFITDYRLPNGIDGLTTIKNLREEGLTADCVLVTGYGDEAILLEALRTGVKDFVPKNTVFFDSLKHVVSRIFELKKKETELAVTKRWGEALMNVGSVLEAAGVDYWMIAPEGNSIFPKQLFESLGINCNSFEDLNKFIDPALRTQLFRIMLESRRGRKGFELLLPIKDVTKKWLRVRGAFDHFSHKRIYGVIWDETNSINNEVNLAEALKQQEEFHERLKLQMIETHHRVKNGFQLVRSLLNMELRKKGVLSKESVTKVSTHLSGLVMIHDMLTEQVKLESSDISVDELMNRLAQNLSSEHEIMVDCESMFVAPRIASTLAVIASELLINALKYGGNEILIKVKRRGEEGVLTITNNLLPTEKIPDFKTTENKGTGVQLLEFLAQADFKNKVIWSNINDKYVKAEVSFPIITRP